MSERNQLLGSARVRRRWSALADLSLNFDRSALDASPDSGWHVDDVRQSLPSEPAGPPVKGGSFEIAQRLIGGYEFADPSVVRAYYDPSQALLGRNMLLRLRALGVFQVYVGVRVLEVIDDTVTREGREAHVWGWRYGTLQGHVERGEMSWEVWKWPRSGEVEFRVHAISRAAPITNPIVRLGFKVVGPHERVRFLRSTRERMQRLTELGLSSADSGAVRAAAQEMTGPSLRPTDAAYDALVDQLDAPSP